MNGCEIIQHPKSFIIRLEVKAKQCMLPEKLNLKYVDRLTV